MFKGPHFEQSVISLCVRWYLSYGLSLRDLKEIMAERGISIDHSTIHRWVVHFAPLLADRFNRRKRAVTGRGMPTRPMSRFAADGRISIAPSTATATRSSFGSASIVIFRPPNASSERLSPGTAGRSASSSMAARPTGKRSFPVTPQAAFRIGPAVALNPYAFDRVSI